MLRKLVDRLTLKFGWNKTSSPALKAKASENATINQRNIQMQDWSCYIEGNALLQGKTITWAEKKGAGENLTFGFETFFYMVIGRNGFGGFMVAQNLNPDGSIKEHCLQNCKHEFGVAKEKLKTSIKENVPKLEEPDQKKLYKLQDALLEKDLYDVTNQLKEETMSRVHEMLEKYR